jgi:HK97 family phage major capsid protein
MKTKIAEASLAYWKALTAATASKELIDAAKAALDRDIAACTDAEQTTLKAAHTEIKDWKAPATQPPNKDANIVTLEEIQNAVAKSVTDTLASKMPEALKGLVTADQIQAAVNTALASQMERMELKKVLEPANLASLVGQSIDTALKGIKMPSKFQHQGGENGNSGQTEIPFSLTKGNLPLHMKQLLNILMRKNQNEGVDQATLDTGKKHDDKFWGDIKTNGVKALTTAGTGTGADWIPRQLSSELFRRLYLESQIAQAFLAQEVQMPTDPYDYPLLTTDPTFFLNNVENTVPQASDPGSTGFTLTTQNIMALVQYSYKVDEDSIIPILPTLQMTLARAGARALEDAIINGDTTATHMDTGSTVAVNDVKRAWKGFRKLALAVASLKVDLTSGGINRANILSALKLLGKWGTRSQDILWIVGPKTWVTLMGLDEVVLAYARGGIGSYIAGGPPPAPWGGVLTVSEQCREDLNATGIWDNSTTTKGSILAVNKSGFVMGSRREFMIEVDRNIKSQTHEIVASFRKAFQPVETPAAGTAQTVGIGYNWTA